jgi:hypothetical protein
LEPRRRFGAFAGGVDPLRVDLGAVESYLTRIRTHDARPARELLAGTPYSGVRAPSYYSQMTVDLAP